MAVTFVRCSAGTLLRNRALLRVTLDRTAAAVLVPGDGGAQAEAAYNRLVEQLPVTGAGLVASPFAAGPDAEAFTVDIRRASEGPNVTAGALALVLQEIAGAWGPDPYEVARVELVEPGEGSAAATEARDAATEAVAGAPSWLDRTAGALAGASKWVLWLVLAIVALVAFLYFKGR